jgi:hypothetical protein
MAAPRRSRVVTPIESSGRLEHGFARAAMGLVGARQSVYRGATRRTRLGHGKFSARASAWSPGVPIENEGLTASLAVDGEKGPVKEWLWR